MAERALPVNRPAQPGARSRQRLARAAAGTLAMRFASGVLSFLVFAQVAASLPAAAAARVLFFSFAFGFVLATWRGFHLVRLEISGHERRTQRWRRVRSAARTTLALALGLAPGTAALLLSQGMPWSVALGGAVLTVLCAVDADLGRAVLGRSPRLPLLTAAGGALGCALLWLSPAPTEAVCAAAFLLQWLPVVPLQLAVARRLVRKPRRRGTAWPRRTGIVAGVTLAGFDGAVLNAPFVLALPLAAAEALDLAVGSRLFGASLALFSLIGSWVISGDVARLAQRWRVTAPAAFIGLQCSSGLALGGAYAALYAVVAEQRVGAAALAIFALLLVAYCVHAAGVRFVTLTLPALRLVIYGATLAAFYGLMLLLQARAAAPPLWLVVAAIAVALVGPPTLLALLQRRGAAAA